MDSAKIREVLGAYQKICTKARIILNGRLGEDVDEVFGARLIENDGCSFVAVEYWGRSAELQGLYSDYELIPAEWFADDAMWKRAKWPVHLDTKEIARKSFGMDDGDVKQGILGLEG